MVKPAKCRAKDPSTCSVHGESAMKESARVEQLLKWIADDEDGFTTYDIASDPDTPEPVLRELAKGYMAVTVAANLSTPADLLHQLATEGPKSSPRAQENAEDWTRIRERVAANPSTSPETLAALVKVYDYPNYHKSLIARNPNTPANVLEELCIRHVEHVSANPAAPPGLLRGIYRDFQKYGADMVKTDISRHLASNPNTPADVLADIANNMKSVEFVVSHEESYEGVFAEHRALVAANESVPRRVVLKLANDEDERVQAKAKQNPRYPNALYAYARKQGIEGPERLPTDMLASLIL